MTAELLDDYWLHRAATGSADVAGAAVAALQGDTNARQAVWDYAAEHWGLEMTPFVTGESYLICTQTLYYVGRVREIVGGFLVLDDASWVHWTGRLSTLLAKKKFTGFPSGHQKPRTERCGEAFVAIGSIVSAFPGEWAIPQESIT